MQAFSHEIGHALGIKLELWQEVGLIRADPDPGHATNPVFLGPRARATYGRLAKSDNQPADVPLENYRSNGRYIEHWQQAIFHTELMTAVLEDGDNEICPVTVEAMADLGYVVNPDAAERKDIDLVDPVSALFPPEEAAVAPRKRFLVRGLQIS